MSRLVQERLGTPYPCDYLRGQTARKAYVGGVYSQAEMSKLISQGWIYSIRDAAFSHKRCVACTACGAFRVIAQQYKPNRSQLRAQRANQETRLVIGKPTLDDARMDLYRRHHLAREAHRGWNPASDSGQEYITLATKSLVPLLEFAFYRDDKIVAVSYVVDLADALLGTYFFYDPDLKHLSLGTWMVMSLIREAAARGFQYAYLGTYVDGYGSLEYKAAFRPNQVRKRFGDWEDFKN